MVTSCDEALLRRVEWLAELDQPMAAMAAMAATAATAAMAADLQ
jgi:hypothetical protein